MDNAVAAAYGWDDLDLDHDFHETAQGLRYTISEAARREVLGRLLELNHARYEAEVLAGLHEKGGKKGSRQGAKAQSRRENKRAGSRGAEEQKGKDTAGPVTGQQASLPGMEDDRPKQLGLFGEEQ